jgi:predicted alpha/beta superfamily hydrolase
MTASIHDTDSFLVDAPGASGMLRVDVAMPPDFPEAGLTRTDAPLPLVIVLDADFCFPAAAAMSRLLMLGEVRPHIVVGIGYPDGGSLARVNERRVFDFSAEDTKLPLAPGQPPLRTGGAPAFHAALIERVMPALAERYSIDRRQVYLYGASMGGWFAGDALLRDRGRLFAGVAIFSGAFFYGERRVLSDLKALAAADLAPHFRTFVSVGSLEEEGSLAGARMVTDASALMAAWRASAVPFEGHVLDGETHNMVFGPAYTRATRYFLPIADTSRLNSALSFETPAGN